MDKPYAPTLVLYCLTATVGFIVDKKLVMEHEANGDFGYEWLKTNYAGSGPFTIREWRANETVVMERNPNYSGDAPPMARVIYRHIPEGATQRLLLEQGDIDIARSLGAEEIDAVRANPDLKIMEGPKGSIYYLGLNQKNENLAKPEVRQAMKYLVDYQAIADTIMKGKVTVHQAFLPKGFLGALEDTPFSLDVAKAKELLAAAGLFVLPSPEGDLPVALLEAMAAGLPMALINPIPGQEVRNSDYLLEQGAAVRNNYETTIGWKLGELLADPARLERMRAAAQATGRPGAASTVVNDMLGDRDGQLWISDKAQRSLREASHLDKPDRPASPKQRLRTLIDTSSGRSVAEARRGIEIDDVLDASIAVGFRCGDSAANVLCVVSSSSVAASITGSQSPKASGVGA